MKWLAHYKKETQKEQTLSDHVRAVAKECGASCAKIGLHKLGILAGLLHDAGKAMPEFQAYLKDPTPALRGKINHSACGGRFLEELFGMDTSAQGLTATLAALAICGHHSGLPDCASVQGEDVLHDRLFPEKGVSDKTAIINFVVDCASKAELQQLFTLAAAEVAVLSQTLIAFCNTLPQARKKEQYLFFLGLAARYLHSSLIDADRYDAYWFKVHGNTPRQNQEKTNWKDLAKRLEVHIAEFDCNSVLNQVRSAISVNCFHFSENGPGVYQMYVPTGGGKTLSAMRFALHTANKHELSHVFYIAPFKTILEQNAKVIREALKEEQLILEHHSDVLPERYPRGEEEDSYSLLTQRWSSPIILTTMVQFLNTLFSGKSASARRFHALSRSVILLDEIQSVPIRFVSMLNTAINFLATACGCTVVLCTATQPALTEVPIPLKLKEQAQMVPLTLAQSPCFCRTELVDLTEKLPYTAEGLAEFTAEQFQNSGSVLVIVNTKKAAGRVYEATRQRLMQNSEDMYYLSASLCAKHRMDVLEEIKTKLANHKPVVCISTQLIEAGVDISFSCVLRSLAGLDRIAQAAGRCNRNGEGAVPGRVYIIKSADENLEHLEDIRREQTAAASALDAFRRNPAMYKNNLLSPAAIRRYYQSFYQESELLDYRISPKENEKLAVETTLYDLLSFNMPARKAAAEQERKLPNRPMQQAFRTAGELVEVIENSGIDVLVPYGEGEELIAQLLSKLPYAETPLLLRRAQRFMVHIYDNDVRALRGKEALYTAGESGIYILKKQFYKQKTGVSTEKGELSPLFG